MTTPDTDVLASKVPAAAEAASNTGQSLMGKADSIFEAIRMLGENPMLSWEQAALATGAVASAAAAMRAWQNIRQHSKDEDKKKAAIKAATVWRSADESMIAYADLRGGSLEGAIESATGEINKFASRSDPRVQAISIAMMLPPEERDEMAKSLPDSLKELKRALPDDAGISQNHIRLAQLHQDPVQSLAAAERAAYGAITTGDAITASSRRAAFQVLGAAAAQAVNRDEALSEKLNIKQVESKKKPDPQR